MLEVAHLVAAAARAPPAPRPGRRPGRVQRAVVVRRRGRGPTARRARAPSSDADEQARAAATNTVDASPWRAHDDGDHRQSRRAVPRRRLGAAVRHNACDDLASRSPQLRSRPSALAVGSAASGLLAYVFFALVTRALGCGGGRSGLGAVGVLVLRRRRADLPGAALDRPLGRGRRRRAARCAPRCPGGRAGACSPARRRRRARVAAAATCSSARPTPWFPLLVAAVTLASAAMGLVRGVLTARAPVRGRGLAAGRREPPALRRAAVLLSAPASTTPVGLRPVPAARVRRGALVWPSAFRLSRRRHRRRRRLAAGLPRRRGRRAGHRPGGAHRRPGRAGAGRRLPGRGHRPLRRAGAVPGAVHAGAGAGLRSSPAGSAGLVVARPPGRAAPAAALVAGAARSVAAGAPPPSARCSARCCCAWSSAADVTLARGRLALVATGSTVAMANLVVTADGAGAGTAPAC